MLRATKRRVQLFLRLLLVGTLIGTAYGGLIGLTFRGTALINSLIGAIDGATITAAIAATEVFLLRTRWGRPLQQAPFLVTFGVKWLVYGVVIMMVNWRSLGQRVLGLALGAAPLDESLELLAARLEHATRDLNRRFLVSSDALHRLAATEQYALEPLGPHALRDRAAPVDVYAVGAAR